MQATHELPEHLREAYMNTDYSFTDGERTIVIRLDAPNPDLLSYLEQEQVKQWAYLTAWNPTSYPQTDAFNREQLQELLGRLKGYKVCKGEGRARVGKWPAEENFFVAGTSREEAAHLGWDFGQYAVLVGGDGSGTGASAMPCRAA